ncbi:Hypothetical_protein [Hexamita inflata]|uniref:Hypothetical_protein n=1 Tax=Hexamita inflata TaxID=28002 RepID=A0AA86QUL7_9EUKA|nr:Hypothetical protein HINF_LOCUS52108 [Hexamita inflata]
MQYNPLQIHAPSPRRRSSRRSPSWWRSSSSRWIRWNELAPPSSRNGFWSWKSHHVGYNVGYGGYDDDLDCFCCLGPRGPVVIQQPQPMMQAGQPVIMQPQLVVQSQMPVMGQPQIVMPGQMIIQ